MSESKLLGKIRALMAKAESSEFPAEADQFMAKAQQLIAENAIDIGLLKEEDRGAVIEATWVVPEPYSMNKGSIAGALSEHLGIYVLQSARIRMLDSVDYRGNPKKVRGREITVYGTAEAVAIGEALFTSLLVQCGQQLGNVRGYSAGDTRTQRDAFILGFAIGLKEQLSTASDATPGAGLILMSEHERAQEEAQRRAAEQGHRIGPGRGGKSASDAGRNAGRAADVGRAQMSAGRRALPSGR